MHTKGPWNIGEDNDVFGADGVYCVAKVVGAPESRRESLGNAALIAAAPTLLEAAEAIEWEADQGQTFTTVNVQDLERLNAAICKARGKGTP